MTRWLPSAGGGNWGRGGAGGYLDVALYLAGVAGLAASLTIIYLGMRAVLNVGGYCAEGGAYVIAQHCPDGVALLLPLSIFAGLGCVALMSWTGAALGGPYAGLVLLAWPALFISLGWNFLEFAFFPPRQRLDALHRSGALNYDEFQRAKQVLLAEAERGWRIGTGALPGQQTADLGSRHSRVAKYAQLPEDPPIGA